MAPRSKQNVLHERNRRWPQSSDAGLTEKKLVCGSESRSRVGEFLLTPVACAALGTSALKRVESDYSVKKGTW